jgi:hypothetical protein
MGRVGGPEEAGTARSVIALLTPTLGLQKAEEVVGAALKRLGLKDGRLSPENHGAILEDLSHDPGLVGVTARFALSRSGQPRADAAPVASPASQRSSPVPDSASARLTGAVAPKEIAALLTGPLTYDKADEAVRAGIRRLGLPSGRLDREQAIRLLDDLARQDGIIGPTARFAKGKLLGKVGG